MSVPICLMRIARKENYVVNFNMTDGYISHYTIQASNIAHATNLANGLLKSFISLPNSKYYSIHSISVLPK